MVGGGGADASLSKEHAVRKAMITGFAVLCEMLSGGLFMENVKMEKQRTSESYPSIMSRILRQGVKGFEAGFWPWGFILGMSKGVVLGGSRAGFLNLFLDYGLEKSRADILSGFMAGGVQGIVMSPILLARTRVNQHLSERAATERHIQSTFFKEMMISMNILNHDIRVKGISTLFIGMPAMVFKRSIDWGSRFYFMRWLKNSYYEYNHFDPKIKKLNDMEELSIAFLGGTMSVFVTMPIDRLMPILQAANRTPNSSILSITMQKFRSEGFTTLQRGFLMRTLHCGWHTSFAIFLSQKIYNAVDKRL